MGHPLASIIHQTEQYMKWYQSNINGISFRPLLHYVSCPALCAESCNVSIFLIIAHPIMGNCSCRTPIDMISCGDGRKSWGCE